jgi:teichuronic acid exporter
VTAGDQDGREPASDESSGGLRKRARGGAAWLGARQVLNNLLRIASISIVARELGPVEFGLAALAVSASRFLLLFNEGGVGTYIIRFEGGARQLAREARSAFWLNQAISLVQVAVLFAGIPLAGRLLGSDQLTGPILVLGATFWIRQMSVVPEALARRGFQYRSLVLRDLLSGVVASVLSAVLALRGAGVYAIVLPPLLLEPFRLVLLVSLTGFRPGWSLVRDRWRAIVQFVKHVIGAEVAYIVLNDGDTLIIGAVLGAEATGIYNLAWQLATLVGRNVVSVISDVSLPTFVAARRRGDLEAVLRGVLEVLAVVTLPIQLLLAACAPLVVEFLYGDDYAEVAAVLSVLAIFMAVRGVTSVSGPIFNVLGTPKTGLLLSLGTLPPYLLATVVAAPHGVLAAALAVSGVRIIGGIWGLLLAVDKLGASRRPMLAGPVRAVPGAVVAALAAALCVRGAGLVSWPPVAELAVVGSVGLVVALGSQHVFNRRALREARMTVLGR